MIDVGTQPNEDHHLISLLRLNSNGSTAASGTFSAGVSFVTPGSHCRERDVVWSRKPLT